MQAIRTFDSAMTPDQARAAADALLAPEQDAQRRRAEKLAAAKQRNFPPVGGLATGALSGLFAGAALGYALTGDVTPWSIFGMSSGTAVGIALDRRRSA